MTRFQTDWRGLRELCAEVLWREESALKLPNVCRRFGLEVDKTDADPMKSKRTYVHSILDGMKNQEVLVVAHQIAEDYDDFELREVTNRLKELGQASISEISRGKLLRFLDGIEISGAVNLIDFLNQIWPLEKMDGMGKFHGSHAGSSPPNLEAEVHRHCVSFPDWSNTELLTKLGFLRSSKALLFRFLAQCVHPNTRTEAEQRDIAKAMTRILRRDGFALVEARTESGYPLFEVVPAAMVGASPTSDEISTVLASFDEDSVHAAWQKAMARKNSDPEGAITSARTLLETVCKHVLDQQEVPYKSGEELPKLWKLCSESLNLAPSQHTLEPFKQVLSGCVSVVQGLGTVRNKIGDAHGQGSRPVKPKARHAALTVDLAGAMATFIVATFNDRLDKPK